MNKTDLMIAIIGLGMIAGFVLVLLGLTGFIVVIVDTLQGL